MVKMSQRTYFEPPAPPPFWQNEPLSDLSSQWLESPVRLAIYASLIVLGCIASAFAIALVRKRWRMDSRAEEFRIRSELAKHPKIGPDAAWLSSATIRERLGECSGDEPTLRTLDALKTLEARRYGPGGTD